MKLIINLRETAKEMPPEAHTVYAAKREIGGSMDWRLEVFWRSRGDKIIWETELWDGSHRIDPPPYWYTDADVEMVKESDNGAEG